MAVPLVAAIQVVVGPCAEAPRGDGRGGWTAVCACPDMHREDSGPEERDPAEGCVTIVGVAATVGMEEAEPVTAGGMEVIVGAIDGSGVRTPSAVAHEPQAFVNKRRETLEEATRPAAPPRASSSRLPSSTAECAEAARSCAVRRTSRAAVAATARCSRCCSCCSRYSRNSRSSESSRSWVTCWARSSSSFSLSLAPRRCNSSCRRRTSCL
mmetsp:Transcript_56063/g.120718  ORF Transcript_56063/g.120718 Transcript_56063/m.120718 type:complete len:211 (+) Transcript_56063:659-1291(+)